MKTQKDFQKWAEEKLKSILVTLVMKGSQYTGQEGPAFWNYEHSAAMWDTDVFYQIMQAAQKHWTFLVRLAKMPPEQRQSFKTTTSMLDVCVYMLLLMFSLEKEKE